MVLKLYVSRTSGNIIIKVQQEHIKRIFDCKKIQYVEVDIADPCRVHDKEFMQSTVRQRVKPFTEGPPNDDQGLHVVLPPQLFEENNYKGDYEGFFAAVETESMYRYLGLEVPQTEVEYQKMIEQQQKQQHQQQQQQPQYEEQSHQYEDRQEEFQQ